MCRTTSHTKAGFLVYTQKNQLSNYSNSFETSKRIYIRAEEGSCEHAEGIQKRKAQLPPYGAETSFSLSLKLSCFLTECGVGVTHLKSASGASASPPECERMPAGNKAPKSRFNSWHQLISLAFVTILCNI